MALCSAITLMIIFILSSFHVVGIQIISKSKLEKCEKNSNSDDNLNCTTKIVLNMAVPSGSVIVLVFILVFHFAPRCGHTNVLVFTGICSLMGSLSVSKLIYCYLSCNVSLMIDLNFKVLLTQSYQV